MKKLANYFIKVFVIIILLLLNLNYTFAQCPTISGVVSNVSCFGGNNGSITLTVTGDTASISNPGLLISEILTDPPLADSPKEWVELIATKSINFSQTPYTIIFSNNGTATSKGWVEGSIPSPPPRNSTYAFQINTGSVQAGDIVYVGGSSMDPTGIKLRVKNTSTDAGDGGIGGAFTGAAGVLGNGGGIADGVALFNLPVSQIDSNSIPVDAIFFGTSIGDAAMPDTTKGFRLPVNDRYTGGRLKATSYLAPEILGSYSLQANGTYNRSNGVYSTPRTWSTNSTAWSSSASNVNVSGYSYLWSNGATTKNISGLSSGTYTVTVTSGACVVNATYTVGQNSVVNVSLNAGSNLCYGATNGSITSTVSGGVSPYNYQWSNSANTSSISSVGAGNYTLTVTDANGCIKLQTIAVVQNSQTAINNIVPSSNAAGYPIQLKGIGFTIVSQVKFNGVNATGFTIAGDTLITLNVPQNANSGAIELINNNGCSYQSSLAFDYLYSSPDLTVKLYLEGLHVGNGYMEVPLVNSGLSGNAQASDSITIQLAEADAPNLVVFTKKALLRTTGISYLTIAGDYIGKSYYIIIKHRNSLETWSKAPILFAANTYYNFSGLKQFPSVTTTAITSLQNTMVVSGGNVTSDGGIAVSARGVVWSTSPGPTVALSTKTIDGTGLGQFTSNISGLFGNTPYYVRAYATNSVGTSYGNEILFTTANFPLDFNGNSYDTVVIGTQTWFAKNLKVANYRNGDPIPTGLTDAQWGATTNGAYAIYNNQVANDSVYGKLYNWYAIADPRGLCPTSWHVPSDAEWSTLTNFLGGSSVAGGKMKEVGLMHWASPNSGADNSSGFTALPGGLIEDVGGYYYLNQIGEFSSSTESGLCCNRKYQLSNLSSWIFIMASSKNDGTSIRCIRDLLSTLTTSTISNLTNTSATCGGNITSAGGDTVTVRGVVWSTSPNPTIALTTKTNNGGGIGSFTSIITGLTANKTYYVRAYATNISGTAYGNEVSFTVPLAPGQFVDVDGNIYDTIAIGAQVWMKQNLKVSKYRNGDSIPTGLTNAAWLASSTGAYAIYNDLVANDSVYGKLYNWYAVADPRGLCPTNWHVPSDLEWKTLETELGMSQAQLNISGGRGSIQNVGGKMKVISSLWASPNTGATNNSGLSGLPGGNRELNGAYSSIGTYGHWWASSQYSTTGAWDRYLGFNNSNVFRYSDDKRLGFSVRCVRDLLSTLTTTSVSNLTNTSATCGGNITSAGGDTVTARGVVWSTSPNPTIALTTKTTNGSGIGSFTSSITGLNVNTTYYVRAYATNISGTAYGNQVTFTTLAPGQFLDIDGNVYDSITIGTQVWMKQNLKVAKYRNGDSIPTGLTDIQWQAATNGACSIYGNQIINDSIYGKLYNWYAVADPRGLCPVGWHVPSDAEWMTLETTLGMLASDLNLTGGRGASQNVGGKLKEIGLTHWASPNTSATNSSAFTAIPGGLRQESGLYGLMGGMGMWWSSSQYSSSWAYYRYLFHRQGFVARDSSTKPYGFSVRCVTYLLPSISSNSVNNITPTSCYSGGNVTSDGGNAVTTRGVCWSTTPNPTTSLSSKTIEGIGTGTFSSKITGLTPNTTYYIRAYATNISGTAYGNELIFTTTALSAGQFIDLNGNIYDTIAIGTQVWMKQNLKVSKYRNGDLISTGLTNTAWMNASIGAYSVYNDAISNDSVYGKLYNGYAVADPRGLCPAGWHIPSDAEWMTLESSLGMLASDLTLMGARGAAQNIGGKMKEIGLTNWASPNTGALNSCGYTGLPGGSRYGGGGYYNLGAIGYWWSSSQGSNSTIYYYRTLDYSTNAINRNTNGKTMGFSVRCVRD